MTALGAIGALLVAGTQLSDIGELRGGSGRLYVAVGGLVASLGSVLLILVLVAYVLRPRETELKDLADQWNEADPILGVGVAGQLRRRYYVVDYLARNHQYLGSQTGIPAIKAEWDNEDTTPERRDELRPLIETILDLCNYRLLSRSFSRTVLAVAVAVLIAAIGIGFFTWAANPPPTDREPPSLRNADLSGADLTGVNLRNGDLQGADLSGADLGGANLEGAKLKNVVWSNTTCPDGVNSDDVADAEGRNPTCVGHLKP